MNMDVEKHISTYKNGIYGEFIFLFDSFSLRLQYISNNYQKNFTIYNINVVSTINDQNKEHSRYTDNLGMTLNYA
jgi:hypothetical protein